MPWNPGTGCLILGPMSQPQLLDGVELPPRTEAQSSVIWLHGLGANGHDFPPIVPLLGLPADHSTRFIFPHAESIPVTINGGMVMPAWYDILSLDEIRQVDEAGVRKSADQLLALVENEEARGIPSDKIVLAGFSQGGAIALHLGLRFPRPLAGLILLSTYMAADADVENERNPENQDMPIFQGHGTHDPMVRLPMGEAARQRMQELGYKVAWHQYSMQHEVVQEEVTAIGDWLKSTLY